MIIKLIRSILHKDSSKKPVDNKNGIKNKTPVSAWSFEKSTIKRFSIQKIYDEMRI